MIWNPAEKMNRPDMARLQLERLQMTVHRAYERVPFYRQRLDEVGIRPEQIRSLTDLEAVPFTLKNDLRDHYPYGLFAEPLRNIIRFHSSSGTTGKPIVVGYTRQDMENWTDCCARVASAAGVTDQDICQISFGYGMFTGGFGIHAGVERVGAGVIPISSGNSERQLMFMQDFGTTVLVATPSYVLHLTEVMRSLEIGREDLKLRVGMFGGEGHTPEMRALIEQRLGILDTQNYGLTEICGPGVSYECLENCGMHINEDHFYPEIINPETGTVLPEGEEGELVLTTLTKEGIPMLRYRTKDITRLTREPCHCGRTNVRMELVRGRSDDMMVIRGVNVFPSQVESVLMTIKGIGPQYQIIVTTEQFMDKMEVQVELVDGQLLESYAGLEKLTREIKQKIRIVLQIDVKVTLLNPQTLERTAGKAKRVVDLRENRNF
ncbi:MAG: phenylacetate--CoA ligase [Ruminococcaceae bacterium]|jgi:phenylacetate-CoA ligase|nr:phenylacetate--CoA ligase [Oscillospiraceae bacterium]